MKFKRGISLALALALIAGIGGPLDIRAAAADTGSSDALAALGIDSSKAPDGFNANDPSNPYGRNTIKVTPVYELYTVGLTSDVLPSDKINLDKRESAEQCDTSVSKSNQKDNALQSTLYGNDDNTSTKAQQFLSAQKQNQTISEGKTTSTGTYAQFPTGSKGNDGYATKGYLTGMTNATTDLQDGTDYAMADVAAGHFTSSSDAKSSQTVMVYAGDLSAKGGLYLRFGDAKTGEYGKPITLLDTSKEIGNPNLTDTSDEGSTTAKKVENFAENPYQLKNYLQVATGDWDNDGKDEVAVYVPEVGNSRIEIYDLQTNDYSNPSNWRQAWTYFFREGSVVSNMISLVSGDVNQDGVDDLACTWGYYYGPQQNAGSRAVVMFGSTSAHMLQSSQEFPLTYEGSNLVRASFAFGDMTGGGKTLILAAQSDADLKANKQNTRYVGLYAWNGVTFQPSVSQNFDLFSKDKDGNYIYSAMQNHIENGTDVFRSLPLCPANTAIISRPTAGEKGDDGKTSDLLYFDSLVISCDENGLNIKQALDNTPAMPNDDYVEYDASAGSVTTAVDKDNNTAGSGTLFTLTQTMSKDEDKQSESYNVTGKVPQYATRYYYKSWWHKLFRKRSSYQAFVGYVDATTSQTTPYTTRTPGTTRLSTVNLFDGSQPVKTDVNSSYTLCLANTDDDTSYMTYTGKHYYTYSDPQVLAVLASPPYFSDLLDRDDLSGNYAESSTTYSSMKGTENGTSSSSTISVGAYVSFEQEFSVFGVKIGSVEAEAAFTSGFTYETEHTSSLEQSITYETTSGEDRVAFYSIPMEIYEYTSYIPDGKGSYTKVTSTVSIPHEASIGLIDLSDYENIAEDYSVLPSISGSVLTHTIGDPSSYPSAPSADSKAYNGDPAKVDFTAAGGGSGITQEISFSTSDSKNYTNTTSIETKAGAGAGGVTAGVVAGSESSAGKVSVNTAGGSFSGSLQNMPIEAKPYGYGMNWRIFCYNYRSGNQAFPVVTYAVTEPQAPSPLPEDFEQDVAATTDDSVTLTWTYDKIVSGFQLYRYYNFPDGSGRKELAFVPFTDGERHDDGTYTFSYTDKNLSPYTEYEYQIQTRNNNKAEQQRNSIYSEPLTCRTKTTAGYPDISVTIDGKEKQTVLPIYPDSLATATVKYNGDNKNPDGGKYNSVSYQWQKLNNGSWTEIAGSVSDTLSIENAGSADKGTYRCRLNVLYFDNTAQKEFSISAYSPEITTQYSKRTPKCDLTVEAKTAQVGGTYNRTLHINAKMSSASATSTIPTGTLSFLIRGTDFSTTVAAEIGANGVATKDVVVPADGAYTVTPYYPGSYVFKDMSNAEGQMVLVGENATGYQLTLTNGKDNNSVTRFTYGDTVTPSLSRMSKDTHGLQKVNNATFKYAVSGSETQRDLTNPLDVGTYTLYAYANGETKPVAETEFTVVQRAVTLRVVTPKDGVAQDKVNPTDSKQLSLAADTKNMTADEIAALHLGYTAVNTAGNTVTLEPNIAPSNYTVSPCKTTATNETLYNNYEFTFIPGVYTVNGLTYILTLKAEDFGEGANKHSVGSASIITAGLNAGKADDGSAISSFTANTDVTLTAVPDAGYAVDYWTYDGKEIENSKEKSSVTIKTLAKPASVLVYFKTTNTKLNASVQNKQGGTLKCTDENGSESLKNFPAYIASGAKFNFTATPDTGWHFKQWIRKEFGANNYPAGTKHDNGSNTLAVEVGVQDIDLIAVFERDSYTLTLEGELTASYQTVDPDDTSKTLKSGDSVTGDTRITVAPKAGYAAATGETYQVNGKAVEAGKLNAGGSYTFPITENTKVSLKTDRAAFAITTLKMEHGTIIATVDGEAVDDLSKIPGGSKVELQARADRGYHFDHWIVNDTVQKETNGIYTISELADDLSISAEFAESAPYTAKATAAAGNGTVAYTLYDIYGDEVETKTMSTEGVTIYQDEEITFTAQPKSGYQVEQWKVDGKLTSGNSLTNPEGKIRAAKNIEVTVYFKVSAKYFPYFGTAAADGSLTAAIDGSTITSGENQPNGSVIAFTAVPNTGKMVEKWTVTKGDLAAAESKTPVQADGANLVDPIYTHTLSGNQTIRVHFTDLVQYDAKISGTNGTGKFTYTTPIQPNDTGAVNSASAQVRTNGTLKLTLTPSTNCVGTAEEIKSELEKAAPNAVVSVTENNGSFEAVIRNVTEALTVNTDNLFHKTYAITAGKAENGSVSASAARAKAGDKVTLTAAPASGYQLKTLTLTPETALDKTVSASTLTYTFTMPANDVAVTAAFAVKPSSGGGAGGSGGAGGGAVAPAPTDSGSSSITSPDGTKVPATVEVKNGIAAVSADSSKLTAVSGKDSLTLDLSADSTVRTVSLTGDVVAALAGAKNGAALTLPNGTVALDRETLTALGSAAQADGMASISIASADKSSLTDAQRKYLPKNSTILNISAQVQPKNGTATRVHALNGTASVSVAYSLKSGENAAHLVAYYLAEDGSFEKLPVIYDAATGKATFKTTHFSTFVITHEYSSDFSDVNLRKWFYNEVNTALENGWFKGLTATRFGPDDGMTRAMLVQVLYRMSGSKAASTAQFTDVADGKWYAEAIAWASENGIVNGFTDGRFQPDTLITRQQLAAILYRYDTYRGHTPQGSAALDGYADAASVESWAAEAMSWANGNGLVTGVTPTTLVPNGTATRAQVAVILSRYTDQ
ncbi:S-layer family protein [Agathobaculum butyriciproducens]|uniref:InlB B-repeat-containing protein n=1 Tax=Agathobaculum butyriciproducens TaxID=1628085 RepID=UPI000D5CD75E|nr:S-layer family protein [Agathobaculum butyriciproducens]